MSVDLENKHI
jgi:hypothetical protein